MTSSRARSFTSFAKPLMTQTLTMECGLLSLILTVMGTGSCLLYTSTQ